VLDQPASSQQLQAVDDRPATLTFEGSRTSLTGIPAEIYRQLFAAGRPRPSHHPACDDDRAGHGGLLFVRVVV
jgi:hypothetical protein